MSKYLSPVNPQQAYEDLKDIYKPYTLKTMFIRSGHFEQWLGKTNEFKKWMRLHTNLFKHAYKSEELGITYDEAKERISTIRDKKVRDDCLALLSSGLRIAEITQISGSEVYGKGRKTRPYFGNHVFQSSSNQIRTALKRIGLKPHSLRKLFATRLVEKGMKPQDLCKVMGWGSIQTAYRYLQPKSDSSLKDFINASL
jgi:integrase